MRSLICLALLSLVACKEDVASIPAPVTMTEDAVAHYCQMHIFDHPGPKGQVFLAGLPDPVFFAQVRDMLGYLKGQEQDGYVAVAYVNDMGAAARWDQPGAENWVRADSAHFVLGTSVVGGMGAPEVVPFGTSSAAAAFAADQGGHVLRFEDITAEDVLGPVPVFPDGS